MLARVARQLVIGFYPEAAIDERIFYHRLLGRKLSICFAQRRPKAAFLSVREPSELTLSGTRMFLAGCSFWEALVVRYYAA